jgi:hypothetical protein
MASRSGGSGEGYDYQLVDIDDHNEYICLVSKWLLDSIQNDY